MKDKSLETYPIAFLDIPEKRFDSEPSSFFDQVARESYFKSLEKAQNNLKLLDALKGKQLFFNNYL
jgi:hypothetical protein